MKSILYEYTPDELQQLLDISDSYSDLLRKIGLNPKGGNPETLKKIIEEYDLDLTKINENRSKLNSRLGTTLSIKRKRPISVFLLNQAKISTSKLLKRLIKEKIKKYQCERCGITTWMNQEISLQLHHIDGNRDNNSLENLEVLCPNCHSQTDNYAGRKKNKKIKKKKCLNQIVRQPRIDRQTLKEAIRTIPLCKIASEYNVTSTTISRWCVKFNLPSTKKQITEYSDTEWETV